MALFLYERGKSIPRRLGKPKRALSVLLLRVTPYL
jgi:hypothetical protein